MRKQRCLVVLGMHRSGTSLLAGILKLAGLNLGNNLLEPKPDNPKGFFEHNKILKLDEEILETLGSSYDDPKPFPKNWINNRKVQVLKEQIKKVLKEDFINSNLFGLKEPRISILLPLYLQVFKELGIKPLFVISKRKDIEIAKSLEIRNNFSIKKSLRLCKKYNQSIEEYTEKEKRIIIEFDECIKNPEKTIDQIKRYFGLPLNYSRSNKEIRDFVSPELKHHNLSYDQFIEELSERLEERDNRINTLLEEEKEKEEKFNDMLNKINLEEKEKEEKFNDMLNKINLEEKEKEELFNNKMKEKEELFNNKMKEKEEQITRKQKLINNQSNQINHLNRYINGIERSLTWKMLEKYKKVVNKLIPEGTRIRAFYDRVIQINQNQINGENINNDTNRAELYWKEYHSKNKRPEILFINHEETRTGAPKILFEIARHLKKRYDIKMISKRDGSMHEEFGKEFGKIIYPEKIYKNLNRFEIARKVLQQIRPKIVYANTIVSYDYALEAKKMGIPVILHIHELEESFDLVVGNKKSDIKESADLFIAVSKRVYSLLVNEFGCDKNKVKLIHEFIDSEEIENKCNEISEKQINKELGKKDAQTIIMSLGSLIPRKGADILMDVSKILPEEKFVWIGGHARAKSAEVTQRLNKMNDNFILLGEKENPFPYLKAADIFVLPSREDPFPLVVLEAMAFGKPIIAFKESGGVAEAIKDCGILLDKIDPKALANSIKNLIKDKEKQRIMGEKAKLEQKKYERNVILPKIESTLDSFINSKIKNQPEKKISIIMPSYNYGWSIKKAIKSVLNQTHKNWELIILDDNSTDNSVRIIESYVKKYPDKIKFIMKNQEEKGLASSYKLGTEKATGDYISFLEADDMLMRNSLETRVKILEENEDVVIVFNRNKLFGSNKSLIKRKKAEIETYLKEEDIPENRPFEARNFLIKKNIILTFSSVMAKREALLGLDYSDKYGAWFDWWFYSQISSKGKFFYLKEDKTLWRIHERSYNHTYLKNLRKLKNVKEKLTIMRNEISAFFVDGSNIRKEPTQNSNKEMKIVIAGLPKSGTTALLYKIKNSLTNNTRLLFEPSGYIPSTTDNRTGVLAKILFWPNRKDTDYENFDKFDKKILIVRDPRDRMISDFLYCIRHTKFYNQKGKTDKFIEYLRHKEIFPNSISLLNLYKIRSEFNGEKFNYEEFKNFAKGYMDCTFEFENRFSDYFIVRYEDFVNNELQELEEYLGFKLKGEAKVPDNLKRVVRTKKYGSWKNWFTNEDITFFKPIFEEYMKKYGYENNWETNEKKIILPEHCSKYAEMIVKEKIEEDRRLRKH